MATTLLDSGPKLDWTRDNQIFLCYKKWRARIELIFRSALSQATPEEKTSYLKYWMGDQGLPLIEKWETTGKLDYSNPNETPSKEGGRSRPLSSGFRLETYWKLLEEEFKPKGNKLLSIIELWTQSKQGPKTLNECLTYIHNLVEACNYGDSTDRIIRDVLIIGCESSIAKDKIIRRGETITLNEVIEILQTEASTNSTLRQFQEIQNKPVQSVNYVSYDSRSKKSKKPSNKQNSSSTGPKNPKKRKCFRCGEPYSRKHLQECRAQNITCNNCGIKGHLQKCCKKSGNFPKDNSNRENQSSSTGTGSGKMNYTAAIPEADYFDERGIHKEYKPPAAQHPAMQYGSMNILRKVHNPSNAILISENGVEIQNTSTSTSGPVSVSVPTPDFPFTEFPSTEVVIQSQIDFTSISDTLLPRENTNSSSKAFRDTGLALKSVQNGSSHEELRETDVSAVSSKHPQSTRDPTTISIPGNPNFRKSTTGTKADDPTALPAETSVSFDTEAEYRSIMPTDDQALMALQDLLSDPVQSTSNDFQSKKSNSLQRKGEDKKDEVFQLIQKIHNQLQQVQYDLQKLHSLHKYEF